MKPADLLQKLVDAAPGDRRTKLLELRIWLQVLAFRAPTARLANGDPIHTSIDATQWLQELADHAGDALGHDRPDSYAPILSSSADQAGTPVINAGLERRRANFSNRSSRVPLESTCPRCGHIHEGEQECGVDLGGGRRCRCDIPVPICEAASWKDLT